jgi:TolA-binding protein
MSDPDCPKCHGHGYTEYMPEQSRSMAAEPCDCRAPAPTLVQAETQEGVNWAQEASIQADAKRAVEQQLAAANAEIERLRGVDIALKSWKMSYDTLEKSRKRFSNIEKERRAKIGQLKRDRTARDTVMRELAEALKPVAAMTGKWRPGGWQIKNAAELRSGAKIALASYDKLINGGG